MSQPLLWKFEEVSRVALLKLCYVDLTGDLIAGLLLSQIVYWYRPDRTGNSKLHVNRDGRLWIAKERTDWRHEIGISPKQFDRACDHLCAIGVIDSQVYKFSGRTRVHVSLNVASLSKLLKHAVGPLGPGNSLKVNSHGNSPKVKSGIDQKAIPYSSKNTKNKSTKDYKAGVPPATAKGAEMNASEYQKKFDGKHKPVGGFPAFVEVKNASALGKYWLRMVPYYNPVSVKREFLTKKEVGQLSLFRKAVDGLEKDSAYPAMHWVIRCWQDFLFDIGQEKGDILAAAQPQISLLLKHYDVALAGWKKAGAKPASDGKPKVMSKEEKAKLTG